MSDKYNLDAHYTNNPKVKRPVNVAVSAPTKIPGKYTFDRNEADRRLHAINKDIYESTKKEEKSFLRSFIKIFAIGVATVLSFICLKKVFKKS